MKLRKWAPEEEMVYGIQAHQPLRLTEISRALGEKVSVKMNVERLSRQLGRSRFWRFVTLRLLKVAAKRPTRSRRIFSAKGGAFTAVFRPATPQLANDGSSHPKIFSVTSEPSSC